MKKNIITEEQFRSILKENGVEKTSEALSDQLLTLALECQKTKAIEFKAYRWLGKLTIGILVSLNIITFLSLAPFSLQPALFISISAFIFGVWGSIALLLKFRFMNNTYELTSHR